MVTRKNNQLLAEMYNKQSIFICKIDSRTLVATDIIGLGRTETDICSASDYTSRRSSTIKTGTSLDVLAYLW